MIRSGTPTLVRDTDLPALLARAATGDVEAFMQFYDATSAHAFLLESCRQPDRVAAGEATVQRYVAAWTRASEHPASGLTARVWLLSLRVDQNLREPVPTP
jgi:RNA polymerase sigma-70 factor (ECF subfamily)